MCVSLILFAMPQTVMMIADEITTAMVRGMFSECKLAHVCVGSTYNMTVEHLQAYVVKSGMAAKFPGMMDAVRGSSAPRPMDSPSSS